MGTHVVRSIWHPKLNQIVIGGGDGLVRMYFDAEQSNRGAKLCIAKPKKRVRPTEIMSTMRVITPHALPMFREDKPKSSRRAMEKARKDPLLSRQPNLPQRIGWSSCGVWEHTFIVYRSKSGY